MTALRMPVIIVTATYLAYCVWVGYTTRKEVKNSIDYFLAGKTVTFWFLFFTCWASFSGAGNFVGYAGRAAMTGLSTYLVFVGEVVLGYNVFAFFLAPHLAKFNYLTIGHYLSDYLAGGGLVRQKNRGVGRPSPQCVLGRRANNGLVLPLQHGVRNRS